MGKMCKTMSKQKLTLVTNLMLIHEVYGYTLTEMAAACGVSIPTVRMLMKDPERMTIRQVNGLANLTGIDMVSILSNQLIDVE